MKALRFTLEDADRANDQWGANCGPTALAAVARLTLDEARGKIPQFEARGYTNPTMMMKAVRNVGLSIVLADRELCRDVGQFPRLGLVRIQWEGPWTAPGVNQRWAYTYTHWIACVPWQGPCVFDVNSGLVRPDDWAEQVAPFITKEIRRATGGWYATHRWHIEPFGEWRAEPWEVAGCA